MFVFIQRSRCNSQQEAVVNFIYFCVLSGRTEYQATHGTRLRRTSTFERRPSKRYPSRRHSTFKGKCLCVYSLNQSCRCPDNLHKCRITAIKSVPEYKKNITSPKKSECTCWVFSLKAESAVSICHFNYSIPHL